MELSQRLKELRTQKGWTQGDLAKISGVSIDSIKGYEIGKTKNITIEKLKKIASAFGLNSNNFYTSNMSTNLSTNIQKNVDQSVRQSVDQSRNLSVNMSPSPANLKKSHEKSDIVSIPYFEDVYASAGGGIINYDDVPVIMDFSEDFLRTFLRISGSLLNIHIINARGNSMEPTIQSGELLFVNPTQNEGGIICGCIYVVNFDGDIYVKRIEKDPINKSLTLFSDNQTYKPIVIADENLQHCQIIGRVVAHMKRS